MKKYFCKLDLREIFKKARNGLLNPKQAAVDIEIQLQILSRNKLNNKISISEVTDFIQIIFNLQNFYQCQELKSFDELNSIIAQIIYFGEKVFILNTGNLKKFKTLTI
jgi:hypothetical protein